MEFSVRILLRAPVFVGVVALFALANAWSWARHRFWPICCDQEITVGFPFPFHISGGIAGLSNFYVLGLLLDVTIALTAAVLITWIAEVFSRRKGD